jgi:hypothetical protein
MKTEIEQRQCNRFIVLYAVYKESKADTNIKVNVAELAAQKGIKNGVFKEASAYLRAELLIGNVSEQIANITHEGVKIIEYIITHPDEATAIFPSFKDMGI